MSLEEPKRHLSAHLKPKTRAVPRFWAAWTRACQIQFGKDAPEIDCIAALRQKVEAGGLFTHRDEGLEYLLLIERANQPLHLTPKAWLALTWVVVRAFNETDGSQEATLAAFDKASAMFKASRGEPIGGVSTHDWYRASGLDQNAACQRALLHHGLTLVNPQKEPLAWILREQWCVLDQAVEHSNCAPWGLPRPLALGTVQEVLRCSKRWALRGNNTLADVAKVCAHTPEWEDVYLFGLWLSQTDHAIAVSDEELALLRERLVPDHLAYWLLLAHDMRHHRTQYRNLVNFFPHVGATTDYLHASALLAGLQMLDAPSCIELALGAWTHWGNTTAQEVLSLPTLT